MRLVAATVLALAALPAAADCLVGRWMEIPLAGALHFRSGLPTFGTAVRPGSAGASLAYSYDTDGPLLTLLADGAYRLEDPLTVTMIDPATRVPAVHGGDLVWQARETENRQYGLWQSEGGRLRLTIEAVKVAASITVLGHSSPIDSHRRRLPDPDAVWLVACEGDALAFRAPEGGPDVARFRRVAEAP